MKALTNWISGVIGDLAEWLEDIASGMFDEDYAEAQWNAKMLAGKIPRYVDWIDEDENLVGRQDLLTGENVEVHKLH